MCKSVSAATFWILVLSLSALINVFVIEDFDPFGAGWWPFDTFAIAYVCAGYLGYKTIIGLFWGEIECNWGHGYH